MTALNPIGGVSYASQVSASYSYGSSGTSYSPASSSSAKSDSATISDAAKELAAQKNGTTSQEEASESVSEKLQEQLSGRN
jgi:hypothetical protein